MGGKPAAALKQLVAKYNASQSKYTVVPEYQGAYTESLPKYLNVAQSSAAPAIVQAKKLHKYDVSHEKHDTYESAINRANNGSNWR